MTFHARDEETKELPAFVASAAPGDLDRLATLLARVDEEFARGEHGPEKDHATFAERVAAAETRLREA